MTSKAKTPAKTTKPRSTKATSARKTTTKATKASTRVATSKPKTPVAAAPQTTAPQTTATQKTATTPAPVLVEGMQPVVAGPTLRKRELLELVVEKSGIKRKSAKPVVEAMLEVLGDALSDGRELHLMPFGKVKVRRAKQMPNARVMVTKIRQSAGKSTPSDTTKLPDAAE